MENRFLQLHILTPYPPSNPNRDDMGRPKTAVVGGAMRMRISSQSLKRAWRTSEVFQKALENYLGIRTKDLGVEVFENLKKGGISEKQAIEWAEKMMEEFGKVEGVPPKKDKKTKGEEAEEDNEDEDNTAEKKPSKAEQRKAKLSQLVHFSPTEKAAIDELVKTLISRKSEPTADELKALRKKEFKAADIALFGRMLADSPSSNQEAAAQVAHAFTTHKVAIEDDFFTAVDDLNKKEVDAGSSHLGVFEFSSGIFYTYVCINRNLLAKNLQADDDLAKKAIRALVEAMTTVVPSGKQNSFAQHTRAEFVLAELGDQQPRSLSRAFQTPVTPENTDMINSSITSLEETVTKLNDAYGKCSDQQYTLKVGGEGNLAALLDFCVG